MTLCINPSVYLGLDWLPLVVDKLRVSVIINDKTLYGCLIEQLWLANEQAESFAPVKVKVYKEEWHSSLVWTANEQALARIEMGTRCNQQYFSLTLFPSHGSPADLQHFFTMVDPLFNYIYRYTLYPYPHVAYLELAVDSLKIPMHTFLALIPRRRTSEIWQEDMDVGTLYEGNRYGGSHVKVYDKAKCQNEKDLACPYPVRTRIESVRRGLQVPVAGLSSISNPFSGIVMMDKSDGVKASQLSCWQEFMSKAAEQGSATALQHFPIWQRKVIKQIFKSSAAPWWRPEEIWKSFPAAIAPLTPL